MENYHFDTKVAKEIDLYCLFVMLIGLIEVQRRATLYRSIKCNGINRFGICNNLSEVLINGRVAYLLPTLFFKGSAYPIPYYCYDNGEVSIIDYRWGDTPTGNKRIAMLDLMIKDLTNYLTKRA